MNHIIITVQTNVFVKLGSGFQLPIFDASMAITNDLIDYTIYLIFKCFLPLISIKIIEVDISLSVIVLFILVSCTCKQSFMWYDYVFPISPKMVISMCRLKKVIQDSSYVQVTTHMLD